MSKSFKGENNEREQACTGQPADGGRGIVLIFSYLVLFLSGVLSY